MIECFNEPEGEFVHLHSIFLNFKHNLVLRQHFSYGYHLFKVLRAYLLLPFVYQVIISATVHIYLLLESDVASDLLNNAKCKD